jgi:hypothetical protein
LVVNGGQTLAQGPEQVDSVVVSATHRYSALPDPSVRNVPAEPDAVLTTAPPVDEPDPAEPPAEPPAWAATLGALGAADPPPPLLLHAAATTAVATSGNATLAKNRIRPASDWLISSAFLVTR